LCQTTESNFQIIPDYAKTYLWKLRPNCIFLFMRFLKLSILATSIFLALISTLILLWIYPDPNWAMVYYLEKNCVTCEKAEQLALHDFKNGRYNLISWGFGSRIHEVLGPILKRDYKVQMLWGGCNGTYEVDCYHNKMARLLLGKYGNDFYDKALDQTLLPKKYFPLFNLESVPGNTLENKIH
jgi:hypothetical protein